jgi:BlaI family penicillinase repressor
MEKIYLSDGEWKIMKVLWEGKVTDLIGITNALKEETAWSKSTVFVMLRRIIAKGAASLDQTVKPQKYSAVVSEEDCAIWETESFLSRVYNGSLGLMVSSLAGQKALSKKEVDELRKILDDAEKNLSEK